MQVYLRFCKFFKSDDWWCVIELNHVALDDKYKSVVFGCNTLLVFNTI